MLSHELQWLNFLHTQYEMQSDMFLPPFDLQDIIGPDHLLFLNYRLMTDSENNSFYLPISIIARTLVHSELLLI